MFEYEILLKVCNCFFSHYVINIILLQLRKDDQKKDELILKNLSDYKNKGGFPLVLL